MNEAFKDRYYEEKFINLHKRIDTLQEEFIKRLDVIVNNTEKTNGSIARANMEINEIKLRENATQLAIKEQAEFKKDISVLYKETEIVRVLTKNPILTKLLVIGFMVLFSINAFFMIEKLIK
jgi:hypothetical protein